MIRYVAIVSGLMVGSDWTDQWILQQLIDYLTGQLGGTNVSYTSLLLLLLLLLLIFC